MRCPFRGFQSLKAAKLVISVLFYLNPDGPLNILAGRVIIASRALNKPVTVIPISLKGSINSHTKG